MSSSDLDLETWTLQNDFLNCATCSLPLGSNKARETSLMTLLLLKLSIRTFELKASLEIFLAHTFKLYGRN